MQTIVTRGLVVGLLAALLSSPIAGEQTAGRQSTGGITISGRATAAGVAVPGIWLVLQPVSGSQPPASTQTDASGQYNLKAAIAGKYRLEVRPFQFLPAGSVELILSNSEEIIDLDLPNTKLTIGGAGQKIDAPVQVLFFEASRFSDGRLSSFSKQAGILTPKDVGRPAIGFAPGQYRLFFHSGPGTNGREPSEINLQIGAAAVANLELAASKRSLRVVADSKESFSRSTVAADSRQLHIASDGQIDLANVPAGLPMVVAVPGYSPVCLLAPPSDAKTTDLVLQMAGSAKIDLIVSPEKAWPIGLLAKPNERCYIPTRLFQNSSVPALRESHVSINGLAPGEYSFQPYRQAETLKFKTNSAPIRVAIPEGCNDCQQDYPVKVQRRQK